MVLHGVKYIPREECDTSVLQCHAFAFSGKLQMSFERPELWVTPVKWKLFLCFTEPPHLCSLSPILYLDERIAEKVKTSRHNSTGRVAFGGERWLLQMRRERMPLCRLLLCCFPLFVLWIHSWALMELSIPLAPSAGLWYCEETGFSTVCLPLIVLKAETREGKTFPFPVSFSAIKVIDGESIQPGHCLCQAHWTMLVRTQKKECLPLVWFVLWVWTNTPVW